jgi:hypothetical protein
VAEFLQFKRGSWRHRNADFPRHISMLIFHAVFPLTVGIDGL